MRIPAIGACWVRAWAISVAAAAAAAAAAPHAWSERVCIPWAGERRCYTYTDVTRDNMHSLAASTFAGLCAGGSDPAGLACCTDPGCAAKYREGIHRRLRWGARVPDPAAALSARRSGAAERRSVGNHLSGHHHDLFDFALEALLAELDDRADHDGHPYLLLVQAGPHVGALEHDPIYPYVMAEPRIRAVLFEPASPQFEALTYNYRAAGGRVRLVHAAVCAQNGAARFRQSRVPAGNASDPATHEDLHRLSPLYDYLYRTMHSQAGSVAGRPGRAAAAAAAAAAAVAADQRLGDDSLNYTEPPAEWNEVTVRCARLRDEQPTLRPPEWGQRPPHASVLVVDAEGSDLIVLREALCGALAPVLYPRLVLFEHTGMTPAQQVDAIALLDRYGYVCEPATMLDALCTRPAESAPFSSAPRPACCQWDPTCAPLCQPGAVVLAAADGWGHCEDPRVDTTFPSGSRRGAIDILVDGANVEVATFARRHPQNDATIAALKHRLAVKDFPQLSAALMIALRRQQQPQQQQPPSLE